MADVWLTFGISAGTPSIPNNTTPVTVTVYANWRYGYYNKNNKSGTLTIDGASYSFAAPFNTGVSSSGSCTLYSKSVNVKHNDKGVKTLSVSASYVTGVVGTVSGSASKVLTTIPRVSDLAIDVETVLADGTSQVIATATKKATSFTDVLTVTLGDYSQEVESGVAFSIPMEWINAISGTSAKATVEVETFSGTTSIGTKTAELTITVPESVVPVINDVGITEAVAAVTNAFGNRFVQNLSQLNVDVDASGVYGSTIKSYSVTLDGVNYIQQAFTSNVIKTAGTLDIKVKITDSRGRSAEDTATVNIVEYIKPTITSMVYIHCDSDGTQNSSGTSTKVTIAGKVYPVENQNTKALKLKYKSMADSSYTERAVTISDWTFSVDVIVNNTDPTVTYEYIAELTDKINANNPETFRVTTGVTVLSRLAGGKGVTLFEEAQEEGFHVGGGKPTTLNDLTIKDDANIATDEELQTVWESTFGSAISTLTSLKGRLKDIAYKLGLIANYVVEETESADGYWIIRKWANGVMEQFGEKPLTGVSLSVAWGYIYQSGDISLGSFPEAFTEPPSIGVQPTRSTMEVSVFCATNVSATWAGTVWLTRGTKATSVTCQLKIHAVGKWK